ncbi:hypothetical protein GYMLUDRAFT_64793 [Collybiopsis luxurians FD-317 M1]|uniref:Unplaced genomic scaffold GYMLUscaffold_114, whole genome shotgun sequence n=1 Tax=Collybiopsis luxurians FD-317 M1 TaxID=944289 RepID=A0A0D0AMS3_9AGAR|nr:hypothetical protein GYMLUDRAFT_64793 [Collybiopsis luxurians FD-317 M1]
MSSPLSISKPGVAEDLGSSLGGIYVSLRIFTVLWGILTMQLFHYFVRYYLDSEENILYHGADSLGALDTSILLCTETWSVVNKQSSFAFSYFPLTINCNLEYDVLIKYWGDPSGILQDKTQVKDSYEGDKN